MKGLTQEEVYKLMEDFSILDAACLIASVSPHKLRHNDYDGKWYLDNIDGDPDNAHEAFHIAKTSLTRAIEVGKLDDHILVNEDTDDLTKPDMQQDWALISEINPLKTLIQKTDLIDWLKNRGVFPEIFFPTSSVTQLDL